jgi:hypothetical protein
LPLSSDQKCNCKVGEVLDVNNLSKCIPCKPESNCLTCDPYDISKCLTCDSTTGGLTSSNKCDCKSGYTRDLINKSLCVVFFIIVYIKFYKL